MRIVPIVLFVLLLTSGCASSNITSIPPAVEVSGFDLRPFSERGFLFTPTTYSGEFDAIGIVNVTIWPGAEKKEVRRKSITRNTSTRRKATETIWVIDEIDSNDALERAFQEATALGADALINFAVQSRTRNVAGTTLNGIEISGFAIKRK